MKRLVAQLRKQKDPSAKLEAAIDVNLERLGF